ncbi:MAG: hypothetical protein Q9187_001906 [Circinaria calcarea]
MHSSIQLSLYLVLSVASTWYEKRFLASSKNAVPETQKPVTTVHTTEASASPLYEPSVTQYLDVGAPNLVPESFSAWTYPAATVFLLLATVVFGLCFVCINRSKSTTTKTVKVPRDEGETVVQGQSPLSSVDIDFNAAVAAVTASHMAQGSKGLTQDEKKIGWYTKKLLEMANAVNVLVDEKIELQNRQKDLELALERKHEDLSLSNNTAEQRQGEWRDREEILKQEIELNQREAAEAVQAAIDSKKKAEESCQHVTSLQDELDRREKSHENHIEEMRNKTKMTNERHEESLKIVRNQKLEIEGMKQLVDGAHRLIDRTNEENTTLIEKIKQLERNGDTLFEQMEGLEAARDLLRKEVETLKKKAEKAETRAATADNKIRSLNTELNRAKESGRTVHSQNTKLHNELASANKELNGVRNELDEIKQKKVEIKQELDEVKQKKVELKQELDEVKQKLNESKNELNGAKEDLANSRAMKDSLASQLSASVSKVACIENDRNKAVEQLAEVKKSLEEANRTTSQTQDGLRIVEKDKEISRLKTLLDDSCQETSSQTDKDVEMIRLKEELTTVQRNANDHTSSLLETRQKITTLEGELKAREDQCNGYAHTNATYMNTVETMKKELDALSREKEALLRTNGELKKQLPPTQHAQRGSTVAQYIAKANVVSPSEGAGKTVGQGPQTSSTELVVENHMLKREKRKLQQANEELVQNYKKLEEQLRKVKDERDKSSVENDNKMEAAASVQVEKKTLKLVDELEVASNEIVKTKEAFGNLEKNMKESELENSNLQQKVAQLEGQLAQLNCSDSKRSDTFVQSPSPDGEVCSPVKVEPQSEAFEQARTEALRGRVKLQPRSRKTKRVADKGTAKVKPSSQDTRDLKPMPKNEQSSWEDQQARDSMMLDEEERPSSLDKDVTDGDHMVLDETSTADNNVAEVPDFEAQANELEALFAKIEADNLLISTEDHRDFIRSLEEDTQPPPAVLDQGIEELLGNPTYQAATDRLLELAGVLSDDSD